MVGGDANELGDVGGSPAVTPALTRLPTIAASRITPDRAAYQHASAATAAVACASHSLYLAGFRRALGRELLVDFLSAHFLGRCALNRFLFDDGGLQRWDFLIEW